MEKVDDNFKLKLKILAVMVEHLEVALRNFSRTSRYGICCSLERNI